MVAFMKEVADEGTIRPDVMMAAVLHACGMQDVGDTDAHPVEVLSPLETSSGQDVFTAVREGTVHSLAKQVERRNTFFIDVEGLGNSEAAILLPIVVDGRACEIRDLCGRNAGLEDLASTYYGFQILTTGGREQKIAPNLRGLLRCVGLDSEDWLEINRHPLNPQKVVFDNVSFGLSEVLRSVLVLRVGNSAERAAAATQLGELGDTRAESYLLQATQDEYSWVRLAAVTALGQIRILRSPQGVSEVVKDFDEGTRNGVLESAVLIGRSVVLPLLEVLEHYEGISPSEAVHLAEKAHTRSIDNLDAQLRFHAGEVRALAATASGRIGEWRARKALQRTLADSDPEGRNAAGIAVQRLDSP